MFNKIFSFFITIFIMSSCQCYDDDDTSGQLETIPARLSVGIQVQDMDTKSVINTAQITSSVGTLTDPVSGKFLIEGKDVNKVINITNNDGYIPKQSIQIIATSENYYEDTVMLEIPEIRSQRKIVPVCIQLQNDKYSKVTQKETSPEEEPSEKSDSLSSETEPVIDYTAGTKNDISATVPTGNIVDEPAKVADAVEKGFTTTCNKISMRDYEEAYGSETASSRSSVATASTETITPIPQEIVDKAKEAVKNYLNKNTDFKESAITNTYYLMNGTIKVEKTVVTSYEKYEGTLETVVYEDIYDTTSRASDDTPTWTFTVTNVKMTKVIENTMTVQTNLGNPDHNGGSVGR